MSGADPLRSGGEELVPQLPGHATPVPPGPVAPDQTAASPRANALAHPNGQPHLGTVVQPRLVVVLVLIVAGIAWASLRGLDFYGLTPLDVAYDLDQPPLLLLLVGGWLIFRSRRR
jgi:hypothetical protein